MPFRDVLSPNDVSMLSRTLERHCEQHGIHSEEARLSVGASLMRFYRHGVTEEAELLRLIAMEDDPTKPLA